MNYPAARFFHVEFEVIGECNIRSFNVVACDGDAAVMAARKAICATKHSSTRLIFVEFKGHVDVVDPAAVASFLGPSTVHGEEVQTMSPVGDGEYGGRS